MMSKDLIKKAKIRFFRRDSGLQFFGILSYKFIWSIEDLPMIEEGHIQFDVDNLTKTEDGRIHLNQNYLNEPDYTHHNLIFLICHELLHILKKHGIRKGNRDPLIYNFAADHVIDRELKELKLTPYKNKYNIIDELNKLYPKCNTEEAYEWIKKKQDKFSFSSDGKVKDNQTGIEYQVNGIPGDPSKMSEKEKNLTIHQVNQMIAEARSIQQVLEKKGSMPSNLKTYLKELLKVEIPWDKILEKAIKTNYIRRIKDRSWQKLNNYYIPHHLTMPSYSMEDDKENVGTLVIMIDSSGSISKRNLKQFAYIINKFLHYFNKVILLVHDTIIHQIEVFTQDDLLRFQSFITDIGFHGRGGTSHTKVFKYIEKEIWNDREERDVLSMCMSLTDGYSDIEKQYTNYDWITNNTPLMFITPNKWDFNINGYKNIQFIQIK